MSDKTGNVSLTATARPSASTDKQVGSVELKLGEDARILVEVRAPTKAEAVDRASKLAHQFTDAARTGSSAIRALLPDSLKTGLKLASEVAKAVGGRRLRSLWSRLPARLRKPVAKLAREIAP